MTAEEFLKEISPNDEFGLRVSLGNNKKHVCELMRRFAKIHVEAALKAAVYYAETEHCDFGVKEESILNAYPLDLIK